LPTWPAKLLVPVALGILALRLALQLWGYWRGVRSGTDRPVAVSLIEDAAAQAAQEAESMTFAGNRARAEGGIR